MFKLERAVFRHTKRTDYWSDRHSIGTRAQRAYWLPGFLEAEAGTLAPGTIGQIRCAFFATSQPKVGG
jgi:hypothetical protein